VLCVRRERVLEFRNQPFYGFRQEPDEAEGGKLIAVPRRANGSAFDLAFYLQAFAQFF
jgi:hypothetical protein